MIIPLDVLRVPRGGKQTWRLQFVRGIAARGEHLTWVWDPIMQDAASGTWPLFSPDPRFWPAAQLDLAASAAARPKPRADIYALASIGQDRNLFQQANGTFLPMNVRCVRRRPQLSADADDSFRRHAQSRFLKRRDRSADDRSARVPASARRVPAVLLRRAQPTSTPTRASARRSEPTCSRPFSSFIRPPSDRSTAAAKSREPSTTMPSAR